MIPEKVNTLKASSELNELTQKIMISLLAGNKFKVPGFGTFSSCSRKATTERPACKIAMFRADKTLRNHIDQNEPLLINEPYAKLIGELVSELLRAMQTDSGIDVPLLGQMAVVPVAGKPAKIIFHASKTLNGQLSDTCK